MGLSRQLHAVGIAAALGRGRIVAVDGGEKMDFDAAAAVAALAGYLDAVRVVGAYSRCQRAVRRLVAVNRWGKNCLCIRNRRTW